MRAVTVVSLFAAFLSMVSYVPQAWEVIRSRNTSGISVKMYGINVVCFVAWFVYGLLIMQWAIIVQNVICLILSSFILVMKLLPQKKKDIVADAVASALPGTPGEPEVHR